MKYSHQVIELGYTIISRHTCRQSTIIQHTIYSDLHRVVSTLRRPDQSEKVLASTVAYIYDFQDMCLYTTVNDCAYTKSTIAITLVNHFHSFLSGSAAPRLIYNSSTTPIA